MGQGGQELREHGSGTGRVTPWGSLTTTKPVCRKLQPTNLQLQTTELQDSKDYRNYKLQNSKLQTCQLTNVLSVPSQPGGPQGAGGFFEPLLVSRFMLPGPIGRMGFVGPLRACCTRQGAVFNQGFKR